MAELTTTKQEFAQLVRAFTKFQTQELGIKFPDGQGAVNVTRLLLEGQATFKDLVFEYHLATGPEEDLKVVIKLL
jgi:hypothetical protein